MTSSPSEPAFGRPPRILVCGWAGAGNVGDELLTRAATEALRAAGADVVVASRDPAATRREHPGVEAIAWGPRGWRQVSGIDGVCVGPGGILQDSSSPWSLPAHLLLPWRIRRRGGAIAGIGLGAEPLRRRSSRWLLRRVLGGATVICRDPESADAVRGAGVAATAAADLAFALDFPKPLRRDELVVAIGPEVGPGRVSPAARRLVADDVDRVVAAVDSQARRLDLPVVFVAFRGGRDREFASELARRMEAQNEIVGFDVDAQVERVAAARALITTRYHALVVAASTGTPVLVVAGQPKLGSLVGQLGPAVVRRCASWEDAAEAEWPAPGAGPSVLSTEVALAVLADLVRAAAAARARGPER